MRPQAFLQHRSRMHLWAKLFLVAGFANRKSSAERRRRGRQFPCKHRVNDHPLNCFRQLARFTRDSRVKQAHWQRDRSEWFSVAPP